MPSPSDFRRNRDDRLGRRLSPHDVRFPGRPGSRFRPPRRAAQEITPRPHHGAPQLVQPSPGGLVNCPGQECVAGRATDPGFWLVTDHRLNFKGAMAFECPRRSVPAVTDVSSPDNGCIATDPAPPAIVGSWTASRASKTLPANEHAQATPDTPFSGHEPRGRIQSGCRG